MAPDAGKVAAFMAFDFDGNDEWKAHLRNVELPGGSSAAAAALQKVKAKWYKKTVDPDFDPSWLPTQTSDQPAATGTNTSSSTHTSQQQNSSQQNSSRQPPHRPAGPSNAAAQSMARQPYNQQLPLAILHAAVLVLTLMYMQPVKASLSRWAYARLTMALVVAQGLKVYAAQGLPQALNLVGLRAWAARVLPTSDAQYFVLAVAAMLNPPYTSVLVPFVVLAVYNLAFFLSEHHSEHSLWQKYGEQAYCWLLLNQQNALLFNAQSEVMMGFLLLFTLLLPSRLPLLTFAVWQVLRMRYWSVDAAIHHRRMWAMLDQLTAGIRHQFPILQKVVTFGVNYFHQGR